MAILPFSNILKKNKFFLGGILVIAKRFKFLSLALIFSVTLNIGLMAAFAYFLAEDKEIVSPTWGGKGEVSKTNRQMFDAMSRLTFRELVSFLTNRELIEEGYTKRDLAIAALVATHHFNLEKALSAPPPQVRTLWLSQGKTIEVFPGLGEDQFEAIIRYAYQEKWPLTAKGLFNVLQSQKNSRDESLEQAFLLTPEFCSLKLLFQKTNAAAEPISLLNLIASGSWDLLEAFFKGQSQAPEFSEEKRRELLLNYLSQGSQEAARLLLKTDFSYALKRLEDKQILNLLEQMKEQPPEATKFCIELLQSPRSDAVWEAAALALYSFAKEMPPLPIDPKSALERFSLEAKKSPLQVTPPLAPSRFHVVKEGESLWKISRQYKVSVDEIARINQLENTSLFPGMTLKLPSQGTGSEPPR